jgi:hypothetical protein
MNPPAQNPPMQVPPPRNLGNDPIPPPGLYGDQGGEQVEAADPHKPGTVLRARKEDTFYQLSNPRIGRPSFGPGQALLIDYQVIHKGKFDGGSVVLHSGDGSRNSVGLGLGQQERGTIELKMFGFGSFPKNVELYMTRGDHRWGHLSPTFKVSNSVVMGQMAASTKPRNWTQEEIDRYTKDPPAYLAANLHPGVGQDTAFVGDVKGGGNNRYVEPKGHLLGVDYRLWEWDKEKCFGGLNPVFTRDQPVAVGSQRVVAKDGYAVGSAEVHSIRFVNGLKLHFYRLKADGTLDPADTYASDVFGYAGTAQPQKLGGDGKSIIGINVKQGAIVNAVAFVTR